MFASDLFRNLGLKQLLVIKIQRLLILFLSVAITPFAFSAGWKEIRTSPVGKTGWQYVVCQGGSGWNTCELDLIIKLTATPNQLVAIGEKSTIAAAVTDAYNNPVELGVRIGWTTTDGSLSATESLTDANGQTSVVLTSSKNLGGATVTATALDYGGTAAIYVPFIDKWVAYPSAYTAWANYGAYYGCTAWTPDTSGVAAGTWFTQTAWCSQQQIQWRQDRLQSVVTGSIKNNGSAVPLYKTVTIGISQMNVGTKVMAPACTYSNARPGQSPFGANLANYFWYVRNIDRNGAFFELYIGSSTPIGITIPLNAGLAGQGAVYNGALYTVGAHRAYISVGNAGITGDMYDYCVTPL